MGQVKIVTDTTCDLPQDIIKQYDIRLVPTVITIGDKVYREAFEISVEQFYDMLRTSPDRPVSAPPGRKDFSDAYTHLSQETDSVLSIHVSANFSPTFTLATNMARFSMGAAQKQGKHFDITVVDSKSTCIGLGIIVIEAARLAQQGKKKEEILAYIDPIINNMKSLFMVDDMSYLEKSGRMGKARAMLGSFLNLKPILSIEGGETGVKATPRGGTGAYDKMIDLMKDVVSPGNTIKVGIAHAMAPEKVEIVKPKIEENYTCEEIYETSMGSSVGSVLGPGSFGYVYYIA
ncbi:MAG: DegV family protein [Candidatus Vecturithrix sp.]|jgi:DegV family protein with EDD domain|nr:DegV family protein [Candidatus Vecturithrix sp.]